MAQEKNRRYGKNVLDDLYIQKRLIILFKDDIIKLGQE
uniref:Uncharacterized protein n=1 Tax=Moumouvirus sp. 'Monve' TaxID=1128131 RepID=H2EEW4_9VIRU|nr:hypothetical protein mv_R732 [Moumouvirus Monve]